MIVYRKGNVVDALGKEFSLLAHGCNCCGVMGSGVAKEIKEKLPLAFERYKQLEFTCGLHLGQTELIKISPHCFVMNMMTQDKYMPRDVRNLSYDALADCLQDLASAAKQLNLTVGMPKIGAGLGGGDWKIIEAIINANFPDREIYVYELE